MRTCAHWREPCGYCPTCGEVTADPLVPVPFMNPDGSVAMLMTARPPRPLDYMTCGPPLGPPLDESGDAAVLAQAKRDLAEEPRHGGAISPESLLRFAEMRNKVRADAIKAGDLARVLASDMKLDSTLSDVEDVFHASLLKAGVADDKAETITLMASMLGRMFMGAPPNVHRMYSAVVTPTPEAQAARRERIMGAMDRIKRRNDVDVLAQELYLAYGGSLKWLRTHDGSPLRRWSRSEDKDAMDDGSSAGELERDVWHAVAKVAFEERATTVAAPLAVRLYEVYREHLGGRSSYAAHEPLPLWGDLKDADLQAWIAVASSVGKSLEVNP